MSTHPPGQPDPARTPTHAAPGPAAVGSATTGHAAPGGPWWVPPPTDVEDRVLASECTPRAVTPADYAALPRDTGLPTPPQRVREPMWTGLLGAALRSHYRSMDQRTLATAVRDALATTLTAFEAPSTVAARAVEILTSPSPLWEWAPQGSNAPDVLLGDATDRMVLAIEGKSPTAAVNATLASTLLRVPEHLWDRSPQAQEYRQAVLAVPAHCLSWHEHDECLRPDLPHRYRHGTERAACVDSQLDTYVHSHAWAGVARRLPDMPFIALVPAARAGDLLERTETADAWAIAEVETFHRRLLETHRQATTQPAWTAWERWLLARLIQVQAVLFPTLPA